MPRDAKRGTQTGNSRRDGCLSRRKPGLAAPHHTLEMPWSSFPAEASARTFPIPRPPIQDLAGPLLAPGLALSPFLIPADLPCPHTPPSQAQRCPSKVPRLAGLRSAAENWGGKAERSAGALCFRPGFHPLPPPAPSPQLREVLHVAPHTRSRASTHRIAFGAPRSRVDAAALWVRASRNQQARQVCALGSGVAQRGRRCSEEEEAPRKKEEGGGGVCVCAGGRT